MGKSAGGHNSNHTGGVMCVNWGASLAGLSKVDGTTHTIMFNEIRVGVSKYDRRGVWAMGFPSSSLTADHSESYNPTPNNIWNGTVQRRVEEDAANPEDSEIDQTPTRGGDIIQGCHYFWHPNLGTEERMGCTQFEHAYDQVIEMHTESGQARSQHPGGVNACFADGSVRFIRDTISRKMWRSMNTRDGDPKDEHKSYYYEF